MPDIQKLICPDCGEAVEATHQSRHSLDEIPRREFLQKAGKAAIAIAATPLLNFASPLVIRETGEAAETMVKRLRDTLSEAQKKAVLLPWNDPRRLRVDNNWSVVPQRLGEFYSREQQAIVQEILKGVTSEEGYEKILR
ncbi:MAG: hypothetical protein ACREOI_37345, partial [bacterium]